MRLAQIAAFDNADGKSEAAPVFALRVAAPLGPGHQRVHLPTGGVCASEGLAVLTTFKGINAVEAHLNTAHAQAIAGCALRFASEGLGGRLGEL
ncbi:hypothetical protein [Asticcacaulis excentricus]|uniref:hypothetical protein n=1 Tax=Asticcacaulis excentricus TaxID=78587 RepID=UPI00117F274C|nr:hypothetical protein [Asticcacaulis excentricus]